MTHETILSGANAGTHRHNCKGPTPVLIKIMSVLATVDKTIYNAFGFVTKITQITMHTTTYAPCQHRHT